LDYSLPFVELLHDQMQAGPRVKKHIIHFRSKKEFHACLEGLKRYKTSDSTLFSVRSLKLIHAISCPLLSESKLLKHPSIAGFEEDYQVTVHEVRKSKKKLAERSSLATGSQIIPWGVSHIRAPRTWPRTQGKDVHIGVIDTGIDYSHPDLRQSISRGINLVHRQALPHDDNGHGTHIAGTIAASSTHSGILGVAPKARIHPVKAFDHNGSAYVSDIIAGIDWCVQQNLDIINMSFGMKTYSKSLEQAVLNAYNSGKIIVASSGNDGKKATIDYPAQLSHVISVGAITSNNKVASFSNRSNLIDIYAPGEKIYSAWLGGKYNELSGTSMATAHVSGAIALILAIKPGLKLMAVKKLLKRSSLTGNKSRNTTVEIRRLHARRAVLAVIKKT